MLRPGPDAWPVKMEIRFDLMLAIRVPQHQADPGRRGLAKGHRRGGFDGNSATG